MDLAKNFAKTTVSTGYDASATTIVLSAGDGAKMPAAPFNAIWWDATTYADPAEDPNVEVIRVTAIATDTLTVARAQEGTGATAKNTGGKTYKLQGPLTAAEWNKLNPRVGIWITDHFISYSGDTVWLITNTGSGAGENPTSFSPVGNNQGINRLKTGGTSTGFVSKRKNEAGMSFNGGEWFSEWLIQIVTLADTTDDYILRVGFGDSNASATDHTDGVYFEYDRSSSTNWRCATASNNSRTKTNTSTAVNASWVRLGIKVNAAGTMAEFYINGALAHTETATIPTNRATGPNFWLNKTAGTNERSVLLDYFELKNTFTTVIP